MTAKGVLLVSRRSDPHIACVAKELSAIDVDNVVLDIGKAARSTVEVAPGEYVRTDDRDVRSGWTVWWRRVDAPPPDPWFSARDEETQLATAELRDILLGGLLALDLHWVDEPYVALRAEQTLLQLCTASHIGIATPATIATNQPRTAESFLAEGHTVAKAVSSGPGLAPNVDLVEPQMVSLVVAAPTVLQRLIMAVSDVRVVVVGSMAQVWRRPRAANEPVDWRAADRRGEGFAPWNHEEIATQAVLINRALGLRFGVQDWVIDESGLPVFLEVNPSGSWIFLSGAQALVGPALASLLAAQET